MPDRIGKPLVRPLQCRINFFVYEDLEETNSPSELI